MCADTDVSLSSACLSVVCLRAGCMLCSYWGEALRWGPQHKLDSAEACCEACLAYQPDSEDGMGCNGGLLLVTSAAHPFMDRCR